MTKPQVFVVKGSTPWYNHNWKDVSHVISIDESIPGQATITCDGDVTSMSSMFNNCSKLTSLDLSRFDTSNVTNMDYIFINCSNLASLDLSNFNTSNITGMSWMFNNCSNLTSLDLSNFDTSKVTNMSGMFYGCTNLATIDLSNFDTSNVKDMSYMFSDCIALTTIKGVIDMKSCKQCYDMFNWCTKLKGVKIKNPPPNFADKCGLLKSQYTIVDDETVSYKKESECPKQKLAFIADGSSPWFSNLWVDESHVIDVAELLSQAIVTFDDKTTNMEHMFYHCSGLTSLDLFSYFNTSKVTNMGSMFNSCFNLTTLDLSGFNTSKVTNMGWMFFNCHGLTSLDLSSFDTSNVINMENMFYDCTGLTILDISNFDTSKVSDMTGMFYNCSNLTTIKGTIDMKSCKWYRDMFTNCPKLKNVKIKNPPTGFNESWAGLSSSQYTILDDESNSLKRKNIMKTQVFTVKGNSPWFNSIWWTDKVHVINTDESTFNQATVTCDGNVTNMRSMFNSCYRLTSLDLSKFNTSNVTNMRNMFYHCTALTTLDLSNFDTSNVTNMSLMLSGCFKLTSLDVSKFNTSKVTNMGSMFNSCFNLTALDLSGFNTSKVTNMGNMFYGCSSLTSLDLSGFDTSKVDDMRYMFNNCSGLTSLDITNLDTSKVTDMSYMFEYCISLTTIKGVIDMKSCTSYKYMFNKCSKLTGVKIKNPPSDFESETGISSFQYTIVEDDESNSLKRRNNMFNNFKNHDAPIADIYDKIMGGSNNPYKSNKTIIKVEYLDDDNDNKKEPEYTKATQEVVDTINSNKDEVDELSKSVAKLFASSDKANKEKKEEAKPTTNEEKVKQTIDKEKLMGNKNNNLYHALTKFIYESDFIPAFIWFMENAYNNISFDHQHKRRSYKIYKEIVKGGNLIGECLIDDYNTDNEYCYFVLGGSNRSINDFIYNRNKKAAKLLTNYIIASNTVPYVIGLKAYIECYDGCSLYVPTGTSSVKKRSLSDMYVKTLEKVCFGKDF